MTRALTVGEIARRLGWPVHRVEYLIRSRRIEPESRAGIARVFSETILDRLQRERKDTSCSPPGPAIVPDSGTQEQEPQYYEATKEVLDSLKWMAKDMDYRRSQTALCAEPLSPEMQDVRRIISEMQAGTLIVTRVQTERSQ